MVPYSCPTSWKCTPVSYAGKHTLQYSVFKKYGTRVAHIELLSRERPAPDTGCVCLDNADDLSNATRRDTEASTYPTYRCGAARHIRIRAIVDVEHQRICAFDEDTFAGSQCLVYVHNAVDDEWAQPIRQSLQSRVLKRVTSV